MASGGTGGPIRETVTTYDMNRHVTGQETRMVCWTADGHGHHCDLDDRHEGRVHHDDCCEHGEVTWHG